MGRDAQLLMRLFRLDAAGWARHANPWSVYTRMLTLPLLAAAIGSRAWIGAWALAFTAGVLVWIVVNPRLFPPPRTTTNWASQVVLGERLWIEGGHGRVPDHHRRAARRLAWLSAAGLPFLAWGLWMLAPWPVAFGLVVTMGAKLWFADRMVWLYRDTIAADPRHGLRTP